MRADPAHPARPAARHTERFRETQRLGQHRLIGVLVVAEPVFMGLIFLALALTVARSAWATLLAVWVGTGVVLPLLITRLRMTTVVARGTLVVRWIPVYVKRVPLADVQTAEPIRYDPIRDAGGWGVKRSRKHGLVLNVYGYHGVRLTYAGGRRLLVGSQRADELAAAILDGAIRAHEQPATPEQP